MREVYVIGVGHTAFGKFLDRSVKSLTAEAVNAALADARIEKSELQRRFFRQCDAGARDQAGNGARGGGPEAYRN